MSNHKFKVGDRVMWGGDPKDLGTIVDVRKRDFPLPLRYLILWDKSKTAWWVQGESMAPHITPYTEEPK